jgi:hypothetical protein
VVLDYLVFIACSTSREEMEEALAMALQHGIEAEVEIRSLWGIERTMWD